MKKNVRTHALRRAVSRAAVKPPLPLLERLTRRTAWLADRSPRRAERLAETGMLIARAARLYSSDARRELAVAEGALCREAAYAHATKFDWLPAERWADRGMRAYLRAAGANPREAVRLDLIRAWILFNRGHDDEGFALAQNVLAFFRDAAGDLAKCVETQVYVACMFIRVHRDDDALVLLSDAMEAGYGVLDDKTYGATAFNVALAAAEVGDPDAERIFAVACAHLQELGMTRELRLARVARAEMLARKACYEEALAELDEVCGEFYAEGEPSLAAAATVSLLELLASRGRSAEVVERGSRALEILTAAGAELDVRRVRELLAECGA